jgi:hypothetical protein
MAAVVASRRTSNPRTLKLPSIMLASVLTRGPNELPPVPSPGVGSGQRPLHKPCGPRSPFSPRPRQGRQCRWQNSRSRTSTRPIDGSRSGALPSNTFKGRCREKRCFRVRITKSAVLRNKPLDELLPRIKIAVGVFASTIIVEGLQFILDPPAYFSAESALAAKAQKSPSKSKTPGGNSLRASRFSLRNFSHGFAPASRLRKRCVVAYLKDSDATGGSRHEIDS